MNTNSWNSRLSLTLVGSALALCLLFLGAMSAQAQHQRRFNTTTEGAIVFTGNTLGLSSAWIEGTGQNEPGKTYSIGTFITLDETSVDDTPPPSDPENPFPAGTTSDWRQNGSSAVLELPTNKDAEIIYAELLWGGSWSYLDENVSAHLNNPVTLTFEDGTSMTVAPDEDTRITLDQAETTYDVHYYIRTGIVTNFIADNGAGTYTVSGVPATQDHNTPSLNAAGWTLAVAYGAQGVAARNMTIWVGAQWVAEFDEVDFVVDGFCTPPTGPVTGQALVSAMEGDANRPDDQFQIFEPDGETFVAMSADNNPIDNFFVSQINDSSGVIDERGTFGTANHNADTGVNLDGGRQGWDITGVELGDDELGNDQTDTTLRATSTGDSYVATLVAMTVDVNAPMFILSDAFDISQTVAAPGDTLTFTGELSNSGTADANNVVFFFELPAELSLLSFTLDGTAGDVDGDLVTTADLASGVDLGTIALGDSATVVIEAEVDSIPEPPAESSFNVRPRLTYDYVSCLGDPSIATSVTSENDVTVASLRLQTTVTSLPALPIRGETATLSIEVANTGTVVAEGVTLANPIPAGVTYLAGSTSQNGNTILDTGGEMRFATASQVRSPGQSAGTIGLGESAVVTFQVQIPDDAPNQITNSATVDPDGTGPLPAQTTNLDISITGDIDICGNGRIDDGEVCDDGNLNDGDGCSDECQVESDYTCTGEPSVCVPNVVPDVVERVEDVPDAGLDIPDEPDVTQTTDTATEPDLAGPDVEGTNVGNTEACGCGAVDSSSGAGWTLALGLVLAVLWRRRR